MSTDYPKGGYAFADGEMQHPTPRGYERQLGMTLRDYFAGQALAGWLASFGPEDAVKEDQCANFAYRLADAMIAERKKGGDA